MPKLSPGDVKALLAAEKADALSAMRASKLSEDRATAMDMYNGEITDMPAALVLCPWTWLKPSRA
jgi:hypothetical protein